MNKAINPSHTPRLHNGEGLWASYSPGHPWGSPSRPATTDGTLREVAPSQPPPSSCDINLRTYLFIFTLSTRDSCTST